MTERERENETDAEQRDEEHEKLRHEERHGIPGKGFDGGGGYGGAGNSSAYSGESSWGGQAGYGGSTTRGAYGGGFYGDDQRPSPSDDLKSHDEHASAERPPESDEKRSSG
jgi:hypothetical protein